MLAKVRLLINSPLLRNSAIYTFSTLVLNAVPLILIRYLTLNFNTSNFGVISLFTLLQSFLMPVIGVNLSMAISRNYFIAKENVNTLIKNTGSSIKLALINAFIWLIITIVIQSQLVSLFKMPEIYFKLAIFSTFFQFLFNLHLQYYQVRSKPINYVILTFTQVFLNLGLSVLLVRFSPMNLNGRIMAIVLANLITGIGSLVFFVRRNFKEAMSVDFEDIVGLAKIGLPLVPHTLAGLLLGLADRYFMAKFFTLSEVGLFSSAYQIAGVLTLVFTSLNLAYVPWLYKQLSGDGKALKLAKKSMMLAAILILISSALFYIVADFAFEHIVAESFKKGSKFLPWIVLAALFNGFYMVFANVIFYTKQSKYMSVFTIFSACAYVVLCPMFASRYGPVGITITSASSNAVIFILTVGYSVYLMNKSKI